MTDGVALGLNRRSGQRPIEPTFKTTPQTLGHALVTWFDSPMPAQPMSSADPRAFVVLSIYGSPGVYAMLVGSGLSAAGIHTDCEITVGLVRRVAALRRKTNLENLDAWYRQWFGHGGLMLGGRPYLPKYVT